MKIGLLHLAGPNVWPDHVLSYETGNLLVGSGQLRREALEAVT